MPDANRDFEFYAGGIEDGILATLKTEMQAAGVTVRTYAHYTGQLDDAEEVKRSISQMELRTPFVLVAYAGGENTNDPPTPQVRGFSRSFRHECSFSVIVGDDNPQGDGKRRRGAIYKMLSVVWNSLTDRRLKKVEDDEQILLNTVGFVPVENVPIANLPNMTAFGVVLDTTFKWESPDRTVEGQPVEEVIVGVDSKDPLRLPESNLPGVKFVIGE
jgi:phage gp37-like protein